MIFLFRWLSLLFLLGLERYSIFAASYKQFLWRSCLCFPLSCGNLPANAIWPTSARIFWFFLNGLDFHFCQVFWSAAYQHYLLLCLEKLYSFALHTAGFYSCFLLLVWQSLLFIIFADSQMTAVQILLLPQFMQMKRHQRVLHLLFLSLRFWHSCAADLPDARVLHFRSAAALEIFLEK